LNDLGLEEANHGFREDLVVAGECMFTWYWLADVCAAEGIAFVLGHAIESVVLNELERRGAEVRCVKTSDGLEVGKIVASSADSISLDAYWHTREAVEVPAPRIAKEYRYLLNVFMCSSNEAGAVRINYNT
jgi:hypothetical protein